jgi:serine/threonine-protein kinase
MTSAVAKPLVVDRYAIYDRIAAGGMATVHFGRLIGEGGFSRIVAIKRLHAHFALDPDFVTMFLDEARLAARVRHPNVMPTLDVVARDNEVFLVMEYVEGEPLSSLFRAAHDAGARLPLDYVGTLMVGLLEGLHAAHNAKDDQGQPLKIVHRDISPHNVLVGVDGVPRVIDFGVAKALGQVHTTREGQIRGKLSYMSPEQVLAKSVDARTDIFAASAVLWEALAGRKLFKADNDAGIMHLVLSAPVEPPSRYARDLPHGLDAIVMRGLERDPDRRFSSADEMAAALSEILPIAPSRKVGAWVREVGGQKLADRASVVRDIERLSASGSGVKPAMPDEAGPTSVGPLSAGLRGVTAVNTGSFSTGSFNTGSVDGGSIGSGSFSTGSFSTGSTSGPASGGPLSVGGAGPASSDPARGSSRRVVEDPFPEDKIQTAIMPPRPELTKEPEERPRVVIASPSMAPGSSRSLLPVIVGAATGVILIVVIGVVLVFQSQLGAAPLPPDTQAVASDPTPARAQPLPVATTASPPRPPPQPPIASAPAAAAPPPAPSASAAASSPPARPTATSEEASPPRRRSSASQPAPAPSAKIFSRF